MIAQIKFQFSHNISFFFIFYIVKYQLFFKAQLLFNLLYTSMYEFIIVIDDFESLSLGEIFRKDDI